MLFHFVVLGGCAVKRAFPTVWAGEARRGGKGNQTGSERGRVHQFSVHPPKANLDPTPEPSPALITRTGSTYSSAAVNKNNSSIYVRLTCCLMATMCLQESHASLPRCATSLPWENHLSLRSEETWAFLLLFHSQTICSPPLYPTPKNIYILNQSQVGLSQEKRKKPHGGHVFCFQKQQRWSAWCN